MGRSAWAKHTQKHAELSVSGCYYCEHPPVVPGIHYTRMSSRGVKYTKRLYKEMYHSLLNTLTKAQERLIQPATAQDLKALTKGGT